MGHVEFDQKDAVLAEIKRVLRPDGVTLHGVECMNREQQKDYDEMSEDELRRFVAVDGHVGMEDEPANAARFGRFFKHVRTEPRYSVCVPCEELVKLADDYGLPRCDKDFLDYLRGLSFNERRAFNMAMGYVFERISNYEIKMPASGYLLVKASDEPLGDFYHEHLDRGDLFPNIVEPGGNDPVLFGSVITGGLHQRLVCSGKPAARRALDGTNGNDSVSDSIALAAAIRSDVPHARSL